MRVQGFRAARDTLCLPGFIQLYIRSSEALSVCLGHFGRDL